MSLIVELVVSGAVGILGGGFLGQYWAGRRLEVLKSTLEGSVRELQGRIDRTLFVHRVQFETEFKALSQIWARVADVRGWMANLRPMVSIGPRAETRDERLEALNERVRPFRAALGELQSAVHEYSPFYPEEIERELGTLLGAANAEQINLRLHPDEEKERDWYEKGEKNFGDFCQGANNVKDMIRERFRKLAVIEGGEK